MDETSTEDGYWNIGLSVSNYSTNVFTTISPKTGTASSPPFVNLYTSDDIIRYIQVSSLLVVTVTGTICNVLVLLLFYKRPNLRSFSNRFVLNLSLSHFWQCILIFPTTVASLVTGRWMLGEIACIISGFLATTLNIASVLSLLLIALDRNCAVNSPLHYTMTITKKRTGFLIFLTWFIGALIACPPFFGISEIQYRPNWHMCTLRWILKEPCSLAYASVLIVIGFLVPFLTSIGVYSSMFQAAKDNSERARKHSLNNTSVEANLPPDTQNKSSNVTSSKKKFRRWSSGSNQFFGEEWKAVRTGMLVVTTFTLCWLPYFTTISIEAYFDLGRRIPNCILFLVILCSSSACVINPYIYVFRNKTSRKHVKQLMCSSNLSKNKRLVFQKVGGDKVQTGVNPCVLTASLENEGSEKVKSYPALYQDLDGHWQVFSNSEDRSREEIDETVSNISDDDFFDPTLPNNSMSERRSHKPNNNVHAIYNTSYNKNLVLKAVSHVPQASSSNKFIQFRLKTSLNKESTSSDTTENCSISLESTNSSENQADADMNHPSRRGIGKYLFNTSEELWDSKPHHKRANSANDATNLVNEPKKNLSSFGSARRKSFIHSHMKNRKSSETTLTSSTNSDPLDDSSEASSSTKPLTSNRPKLVRQLETTEPPEKCLDT